MRDNGIKVFMTGFASAIRDALLAHLGGKPLLDLALPPADAGCGRSWPDMIQLATRALGAADPATVRGGGRHPQ